jgi:hypothetical protein
MAIKTKLIELFAQNPFAAHTVGLLVNGQNDVRRILHFAYYTIPYEAEELIFLDEDRASIEAALGQPLAESPAIGNLGSREILCLSVPPVLKADAKAALLQ